MNSTETQEIVETDQDQASLDYKEGQTQLNAGNISMAANAFHNALIGFEQKGDENGMANANDKLGDVCKVKEEFAKAIEYYQKAYAICAKSEDLFSIVTLQKKIAICHRSLTQYDQAINIYLDLLETYEKIQSPGAAVAVIEMMADCYYEMGELEKVADCYKILTSIHANFGHKQEEKDFLAKIDELEKKMEEQS